MCLSVIFRFYGIFSKRKDNKSVVKSRVKSVQINCNSFRPGSGGAPKHRRHTGTIIIPALGAGRAEGFVPKRHRVRPEKVSAADPTQGFSLSPQKSSTFPNKLGSAGARGPQPPPGGGPQLLNVACVLRRLRPDSVTHLPTVLRLFRGSVGSRLFGADLFVKSS